MVQPAVHTAGALDLGSNSAFTCTHASGLPGTLLSASRHDDWLVQSTVWRDKQTNSGSRGEQGANPPTHTTPPALVLLQVFEQEMQLGPAAALENLQQLLVSLLGPEASTHTHTEHTPKQSPQAALTHAMSWDGLHP